MSGLLNELSNWFVNIIQLEIREQIGPARIQIAWDECSASVPSQCISIAIKTVSHISKCKWHRMLNILISFHCCAIFIYPPFSVPPLPSSPPPLPMLHRLFTSHLISLFNEMIHCRSSNRHHTYRDRVGLSWAYDNQPNDFMSPGCLISDSYNPLK